MLLTFFIILSLLFLFYSLGAQAVMGIVVPGGIEPQRQKDKGQNTENIKVRM